MRMKFWKWAHDRVEELWHWIYRTKIAPEIQRQSQFAKQYQNVTYTVGYAATPVIKLSTDDRTRHEIQDILGK